MNNTTKSAPAVSGSAASPTVAPPDVADAVRRRPLWEWLLAAALMLVAFQLIRTGFTNPNFQWDVVAHWFTEGVILKGLGMTLLLTAITMAISCVLGTVLAITRMSSNPLLQGMARTYIWLIVSVPALVQLLFWYNIAALIPTLRIGIPFGGPTFTEIDMNAAISPLTAAIVGFSLLETAYMAEIIRGGLLSVPKGQIEAATSLGLSRFRTLRRIRIPQAMRFILPPTASQVIRLVQGTSLVSMLSLSDLLYSVQIIYNRTFQPIPLLIVASLWYLIINSALSLLQMRLEAHYGKSVSRRHQHVHPSMSSRLRRATRRS